MAYSSIESRFRTPDSSKKAPTRVLKSLESDVQIIRDSLIVLNVFIAPFEEVFTQMVDPQKNKPVYKDN